MINKITFTGRETMLTRGIKEDTAKIMHEYVGADKIYTEEQIDLVRRYCKPQKVQEIKPQYTSPFTLTEPPAENKRTAARNGFLYNVAHGKPIAEAEKSAQEVNQYGGTLDFIG